MRDRLDEDDFDDDDLVGPRSGGTPAAGDADEARPARPRRAAPRARRGAEESFSLDDDEGEELTGPRSGERGRASRPSRARRGTGVRGRSSSRPTWERDWMRSLVSDIPNFAKLLWGLARDPRVSKADKAIVVGVLIYAALPADVIPDWIPGLGEVEDLLLVGLALSRLLGNAGEDVLMDHWDGDEDTLETLIDALEGATEFLPGPIRGLLGGRR
ncbi:MAG TPA: YkvA family protein [Longimicrobium sp.]|nr:YkvA family protein [Longimicrobium sp.]